MNRKRFLSLALATALALSLAACGDTSGKDSSDSSGVSESSEESGSPEEGSGQADDSSVSDEEGGSPEEGVDQAEEAASDSSTSGEGEENADGDASNRKDELMAQAETVNWSDMGKATLEDVDGAKALYEGKTLLVKGYLKEINPDGLVKFRYYPAGDPSGKTAAYIWATLPAAEAEYLDATYLDQQVSIVGTISGTNAEEGPVFFYFMEEAYLVSDTTEFVCTLIPTNTSGHYEAKIEGWEGSVPLQVFLADGQEVPEGEEVTIRGKLNRDAGTETLIEAVIVE